MQYVYYTSTGTRLDLAKHHTTLSTNQSSINPPTLSQQRLRRLPRVRLHTLHLDFQIPNLLPRLPELCRQTRVLVLQHPRIVLP